MEAVRNSETWLHVHQIRGPKTMPEDIGLNSGPQIHRKLTSQEDVCLLRPCTANRALSSPKRMPLHMQQ